jgi:hypothetical protein
MAAYLFIGAHTCFAGDTLQNKYPCVLLLQLRSEGNRITAITRSGNTKKLEEVKYDAENVRKAMINDFKEDFSYCPVYYFIDSNADLIKNKHFGGILMTLDGTILQDIPECLAGDQYLIVYYGFPVAQSRKEAVVKDPDREQKSYGNPSGRGLVMLNDRFEQVSYIYKLGTAEIFGNAQKKKNYYASAHFDMEYYPLANKFDEKLKERKGQSEKIKKGR